MPKHTAARLVIGLLIVAVETARADEAANRKLAERYFEMLGTGRIAVADEILAADVQFTNPPTTVTNRDDFKKVVEGLRGGFPDVRFDTAEIIVEGDTVAVRWTMTGTNTGPFAGQPPTGKKIRVTGMDFFHIAGGRIRQVWVNMDLFGMLQQLGAFPAPPK